MRDPLREKVTIAYPFGNITPEFHASLLRLAFFDLLHGKRLVRKGSTKDAIIGLKSTHLAMARNKIVRGFLDECESDWLVFIDTDQEFPPDLLERLIDSADPVERPIVSALIVAMRAENELSYACALPDGEGNLRVPASVPSDRWWACIPGCGVVIIHRSVLQAMREEYEPKTAFPWFAYPDMAMPDGSWDTLGEDYTFMLRALGLGFTPLVDTTIELGHVKTTTLYPFMVPGRTEAYPSATVAVVPFKDKWKMTKATAVAADADLVLLLNNGSTQDATQAAVKFASEYDHVEVLDCKGLGIHEMWNAGARVALERFPKADIAFLNNDLALGDGCLQTLSAALRAGPENLVAVCPNYDKRAGDPQQVDRLQGIAANRYDGTGGLAGFAFMVKGEWFRTGYEFPEDCMWWFGDNDLTMAIDAAGGWYGMVHAAEVEHLDGGGQTGDWSSYMDTPQGQADLAAFKARWNLTEAAA